MSCCYGSLVLPITSRVRLHTAVRHVHVHMRAWRIALLLGSRGGAGEIERPARLPDREAPRRPGPLQSPPREGKVMRLMLSRVRLDKVNPRAVRSAFGVRRSLRLV